MKLTSHQRSTGLLFAAYYGTLVSCNVAWALSADRQPQNAVCTQISNSISPSSAVYYPGDLLYAKGISHYSASATEQSQCVVEPGTAMDIGKILVILGSTRTPFAVKGGGHSVNPHFSSTRGVHISMYRFSKVEYNAIAETVDIGTGLIWDDVYAALEPFGVNVIGGRITGVGVAGFTLGGGYSFKTNQYGLAIDNVVAFELVKPNGKVVRVTDQSDPQLFFGLKGGQNNFGIVTEITMKALPQTEIWGGVIFFPANATDAVATATEAFQSVVDPKAAVVTAYNFSPLTQLTTTAVSVFYDAPSQPEGIFDAFLSIPGAQADIGTRSYLSMVLSLPTNFTEPTRVLYGYIPNLNFTTDVGKLLENEAQNIGIATTNKTLVGITHSVDIFLPSIYSHNSQKTAFPPTRNLPFRPFNIGYEWSSSEFDVDFHNTMIASQKRIVQGEISLGQTNVYSVPYYPNYASFDTPLEKIYGTNLPALRKLKKRIDPDNVMGLAGGWKF